ncbi:hypothetical protein [Cetobacterium somerae]|uniref:hypothetical protein n=1 Tax=Cetobacterium somerae TaxID=188913 RepID=UPI0038919BEA
MLITSHPDIPRTGKLVKVTLHLDEVIAEYLKSYSKENRLTMSYIVEVLIGSAVEVEKC